MPGLCCPREFKAADEAMSRPAKSVFPASSLVINHGPGWHEKGSSEKDYCDASEVCFIHVNNLNKYLFCEAYEARSI